MNSKIFKSAIYLLLIPMLILTQGCGYSEVSPLTTEYAKAIYSIANLQKSDRISSAREQIETDVTKGKLPANEAELLYDMLDKAEAGNWESAMKDSRALMEAQIKK